MSYEMKAFEYYFSALGAVYYAVQERMTIQEKATKQYCLFSGVVQWRDISLQVVSTYKYKERNKNIPQLRGTRIKAIKVG